MVRILELEHTAPPEGCEILSSLGKQTFRETFGSLFTGRELDIYLERTFAPVKMAASLKKENNYFLLAYEEDRPVGYSKMKIDSHDSHVDTEKPSQLQKIYVLKETLARGVGQRLLDQCVTHARSLSRDCLWLDVLQTNERAIRFYEKNGFKTIGDAIFTIATTDFHYYVMNLDLR